MVMSQNVNQCRADLEAILFASGEPVNVARMAQAIEADEDTVDRLCEDLRQEYEMRRGGIQGVCVGGARGARNSPKHTAVTGGA